MGQARPLNERRGIHRTSLRPRGLLPDPCARLPTFARGLDLHEQVEAISGLDQAVNALDTVSRSGEEEVSRVAQGAIPDEVPLFVATLP
jgi:hypothetical protein